MDPYPPSPEQQPPSEVDKLQDRLQQLFVDYPNTLGLFGALRYVNGRKENVLAIYYVPAVGEYVLSGVISGVSQRNAGYMILDDILTGDGKFVSGLRKEVADPSYDECMAEFFNGLLSRSTDRPYGRWGRMLMGMRLRRTRD